METVYQDRLSAQTLTQGGVIAVLFEQHARIREQFDTVAALAGDERLAAFDLLRRMLAEHESAEEVVLRPVSAKLLRAALVAARNREEQRFAADIAAIEGLDADSPEFERALHELGEAVTEHAENEEAVEFPVVLGEVSERKRLAMGRWILRAQQLAPEHGMEHGSAGGDASGDSAGQTATWPFSALLAWAADRLIVAREEIGGFRV